MLLQIGCVMHRSGRDVHLVEEREVVCQRASSDELADRCGKFVNIPDPRCVTDKARIADHVGTTHRLEQALYGAFHPGRQRDELLVAGLVDVARCVGWRAATPTRHGLASQPVFKGQRAEQLMHRVEQRQVDDLSAAAAIHPPAGGGHRRN